MFSFLRRPSTPETTVEELDELRRDRAVRILDVRADWEFKRGHVPGAVHVPLKQLSARAGTLPHGGRYMVICQPAVGAEAQRTTFISQGFDGAVSVRGGTGAWARSGKPLR